MQPALLLLGAVVASSNVLDRIPLPVMVRAIRRHATKDREPIRDGQPILGTCCFHGTSGFFLLTDADRLTTAIRLDEEA